MSANFSLALDALVSAFDPDFVFEFIKTRLHHDCTRAIFALTERVKHFTGTTVKFTVHSWNDSKAVDQVLQNELFIKLTEKESPVFVSLIMFLQDF